MQRAFTLVELVVSIAIFAFMTALLVAKYGNFNQSVLLTDLAYDTALTLRTAQTYGLSVKSTDSGFSSAYGVDFDRGGASCNGKSSASTFAMYADSDLTGVCSDGEAVVNAYTIKRGATVSDICVGTGPGAGCSDAGVSRVDITFRRPDPDAIIRTNGSGCVSGQPCTGSAYAEITLRATDGSTRIVAIRANGQISVKE